MLNVKNVRLIWLQAPPRRSHTRIYNLNADRICLEIFMCFYLIQIRRVIFSKTISFILLMMFCPGGRKDGGADKRLRRFSSQSFNASQDQVGDSHDNE